MKIERFDASERMCDMVATEGLVFVSGQVPDTLDATIEQQTNEVLRKLDVMLARAGTDKSRLLTTTIYLSDFRHYAGLNSAWDQWVDKGSPPARDCFKLELANPGWKLEIVATAVRPDQTL
ncbi:MAG: RidA family protein [Polaromonas sp.]|uniref:RidA family protein n=1 Tax=Polaromonas sp. TaxID=1869339 RepID=UPI001809C5C1|nr:RidA family protein [Polaromonas sp.]NMM11694.1 RidA family protein [Polaromonas sp.]